MNDTERQVLAAADALIEAFARHDRDAYFASFASNASFVFHHVDTPLRTRADYEALWRDWEREQGFAVLGCESRDRDVQVLGDTAVFTHSVRTQLRTVAGADTLNERETIVFARAGHRWLAVHEHLSPMPVAIPTATQDPHTASGHMAGAGAHAAAGAALSSVVVDVAGAQS
jgi:ketosteroid isomerase-like protein